MKAPDFRLLIFMSVLLLPGLSIPAETVPTEVQLPGTQPQQVGNMESPGKCQNCHAGYNDQTTAGAGQGEPQDEPWTGWSGAGMANAGRDPIFWATLAIAEQDFDGAGDLCIRCHSTAGWYGGRSTPTDGSGLLASDSDGVDCDACHLMTNVDNSEHTGEMVSPFFANCSNDPNVPDKQCGSDTEGFYGSGMLSLWSGDEKLGPYEQTAARHKFMQSAFHRSVDFCGSCHDVSNSVVGDLAPGNGAQPGAPHVLSSQDYNGGEPDLGGPVEEKAAFNNPPYAYGIVERTFSEYKSSALPTTLVSQFNTLPPELKLSGGSLEVTYRAALEAGTGGNYQDGSPRYFSCQSCHMRPTTSAGADKADVLIRQDLPAHDHVGGNYWLADMIKYQDANGLLRLGGGLTSTQLTALELGQQRAIAHLQQSASLQIEGDVLKVINLTGHKLITGYPEGRRMWLNIKWYDNQEQLVREDGAYGPLVDSADQPVMIENPAGGPDVQVESIMDLHDPNTRIYEAHYAITSEWAATLLATGKPADFALSYDRYTGEESMVLGDLASQGAGSFQESFHFALNNAVSFDNRIPPYGMAYDESKKRNVLPQPEDQYGAPGSGGVYQHWDQLDLRELKPDGAVSARINLLYQGTSWEYIQFLKEANEGTEPTEGGNEFLGDEGENMLNTWINAEVPAAMEVAGDHKMVPPVLMASINWGVTYLTIGGTVSGLAGSGLVLQNNQSDDYPVDSNGSFTFDTALTNGSDYLVEVSVQPSNPNQTCSVTNGNGTLSGHNISNVSVSCVYDAMIFKDGFEQQ
ncbi:MAG: hypothetical protein OET41_06290 [Xanthomonadales bacterium]|nr:hypothetical protein [Xanthomonadales bacterium]MDH4000784.1 hypothetical protein [Xanthomonadales bacterium]